MIVVKIRLFLDILDILDIRLSILIWYLYYCSKNIMIVVKCKIILDIFMIQGCICFEIRNFILSFF